MTITDNWKKYTSTQLSELRQRDFLTDEVWIRWKQDFDSLLSYRKSIKGKPTDEQLAIIRLNEPWISFYKKVLFNNN